MIYINRTFFSTQHVNKNMRPGCMRDRNKKKTQSILIVKQNALLFLYKLLRSVPRLAAAT